MLGQPRLARRDRILVDHDVPSVFAGKNSVLSCAELGQATIEASCGASKRGQQRATTTKTKAWEHWSIEAMQATEAQKHKPRFAKLTGTHGHKKRRQSTALIRQALSACGSPVFVEFCSVFGQSDRHHPCQVRLGTFLGTLLGRVALRHGIQAMRSRASRKAASRQGYRVGPTTWYRLTGGKHKGRAQLGN